MNDLVFAYCFGISEKLREQFLPEGMRALRDAMDILVLRMIHLLQNSYMNFYYQFSEDAKGVLSLELLNDTYSSALNVLNHFRDDDCLEFISKPEYLTWSGFQEYFLRLCNKYNLKHFDAEPEYTCQAYMALTKATVILVRYKIESYDSEVIAMYLPKQN